MASMVSTISHNVGTTLTLVCIDSTTFHEPKTMLHKVEKALMLETDVSETPNEMIFLARKFGRIG